MLLFQYYLITYEATQKMYFPSDFPTVLFLTKQKN